MTRQGVRRLCIGGVVWTSLLVAPLAWAASPSSRSAPVIDDAPFGRFGRSITARFLVRATPQEAYEVLTDHERMAAYMPMVEEAAVVSRSPGRAVVRFRVRYLHWFDITEVDERTFEPPSRIRWHATEGPLRVSDGSWTFIPASGGTLVTYQTDVDPGVPLPSVLTGMLLRQGLPAFLDAVRLRIESGGKWRRPVD